MKFTSVFYRLGSLTLASWLIASTAAAAFTPRNVSGRPNYRRSGGTRDPIPSCLANPEDGKVLTALVPETTSLTTAAYPDFQWFMPANSATYLEFKLYRITTEEDLVPLYQMAHTLSGEEGIATLSLPDQLGLAPLETDTTYYWSLEVYCETGGDQADMSVFGYVERVEMDAVLQNELAAAETAVERATIAADNGLWHDAARYLIDDMDNASAVQAWQDLLDAVDLTEIGAVPPFRRS